MDTEFPGVVARPIGEFKSTSDYQYQVSSSQISTTLSVPNQLIWKKIITSFVQLLRCNVDLLKIIQLGLTFFNKEGEMPEGVCTWQVNPRLCIRGEYEIQTIFAVQLQVQSLWGYVRRGQCGAASELWDPIWPPRERGLPSFLRVWQPLS